MKRTSVSLSAIGYVLLMITVIAAFFIDYPPNVNVIFIRTLCILAFALSVIGLIRLRKLK